MTLANDLGRGYRSGMGQGLVLIIETRLPHVVACLVGCMSTFLFF